jgi:hypothetical protein
VFLPKKFIKWRRYGEVVSLFTHPSSTKLLNGFARNLVLGVYTNSCRTNSVVALFMNVYVCFHQTTAFNASHSGYTFRHVMNTNITLYLNECMKEESIHKAPYLKLKVNFVNYEVGSNTAKSDILHKMWISLWTNELHEKVLLWNLTATYKTWPAFYGTRRFITKFTLSNRSFGMVNIQLNTRKCFLNLSSSVTMQQQIYICNESISRPMRYEK